MNAQRQGAWWVWEGGSSSQAPADVAGLLLVTYSLLFAFLMEGASIRQLNACQLYKNMISQRKLRYKMRNRRNKRCR